MILAYDEAHSRVTDTYVTFKCSACGVKTDIEGVPDNIVAKLPERKNG